MTEPLQELEQFEKLTKGISLFRCQLCETLIGKQMDREGRTKPESKQTYYRIKLDNPTSFIFACCNCTQEYKKQIGEK